MRHSQAEHMPVYDHCITHIYKPITTLNTIGPAIMLEVNSHLVKSPPSLGPPCPDNSLACSVSISSENLTKLLVDDSGEAL